MPALSHIARKEKRMAVRFRSSGCLFSIVASIVLTIVLNVLLRACSSGGGGY